MSFIYRQDVFNAIVDILLGKEGIESSYTKIYEDIKEVLGKKISHSDFSNHIRNMEKDGILCRNDPSGGRRGTKVFFSLSEYAKKKHKLGILKINDTLEKRKRLLRLLFCFHVYRRFPLLTARQLPRFLKSIGGYSKNDLKESSPKIPDNSSMPIDIFGNRVTVYELINGIQIVKMIVEKAKRRHKETFYYPVIPGFSVEEFLCYVEDLRNLKEPRPFSGKIPSIPYIRQDEYSESEVDDAIKYLLDAKIIRRIRSIFSEDRFDIVSQELKDLAYAIWSIYQIDIHSLLGKILFIEKSSEEDKEYLNSYFGHLSTEKSFLVNAHDYRRDMKKQGDKSYKQTKNFFSKGLPESRPKLVEELLEKYKNMVNNKKIPTPHRVIHELLYDILYPTPVYRI